MSLFNEDRKPKQHKIKIDVKDYVRKALESFWYHQRKREMRRKRHREYLRVWEHRDVLETKSTARRVSLDPILRF